MLKFLLKKRDFPLIVFLGFPQTILDVISFVVLFSYFYVGLELKAPPEVPLLYIIYYVVVYYIIKNNTDNEKYKISLDIAKNGIGLCVGFFLARLAGR